MDKLQQHKRKRFLPMLNPDPDEEDRPLSSDDSSEKICSGTNLRGGRV